MDKTYRVFVNGKFITGGNVYSEIFQRALGIVIFLGMPLDSFENSKSTKIIDRWKSKDHLVIITKNV